MVGWLESYGQTFGMFRVGDASKDKFFVEVKRNYGQNDLYRH